MAQKKHEPEEIVAKLRQVDVLVSQRRPVAEAIRATAFTYYRWRKEFGGLKSDRVKRLKELEKENERLTTEPQVNVERYDTLLDEYRGHGTGGPPRHVGPAHQIQRQSPT